MPTITPYDVFRSRSFVERGFYYPSEWVDALDLAQNTAESYTIPSGARFLIIESEVLAYMNPFGTAAVPSADVTDGTASMLLPPQTPINLYVGSDHPDDSPLTGHTAITAISFIEAGQATSVVTIEVFK